MNNPALISDTQCQLALMVRRMKFLTTLLTVDDAQHLTQEQTTDLHFWLDEVVDRAQALSDSLGDAIDNEGGAA